VNLLEVYCKKRKKSKKKFLFTKNGGVRRSGYTYRGGYTYRAGCNQTHIQAIVNKHNFCLNIHYMKKSSHKSKEVHFYKGEKICGCKIP
jgi:hypothetical protein